MRVYYGRKTRPSGRLLEQALRHIDGPSINFGYQRRGVINSPRAVRLAANKQLALKTMALAGVPVPELYDSDIRYPCVGRTAKHYGGGGFFPCHDDYDLDWARRQGATHFMEFIEGGREFRVHIAFGKSIKIAEKIGPRVIKNFKHGAVFVYPQDFNHKQTLRKIAREAVMSLGLDFGAVDLIYKDRRWFVLEVNSAPSLTSASDVLARYVRAFKEEAEADYGID